MRRSLKSRHAHYSQKRQLSWLIAGSVSSLTTLVSNTSSILCTSASTLANLLSRAQTNQRKNLSFTDAARHAPELTDETKQRAFLDNLLRQQGKQKQLQGIRTASMFLLNQRTAQRGQQIRDIRVAQRLNFVIPPAGDGASSMQPMELMGFTKDTGKTCSGDSRSIATVAPHRDVSMHGRLQAFLAFTDSC